MLEFFLAFSSITKPVSPTNARPLAWFIIILVFTTMMWAAAFSLMFVMRSNGNTYEVIKLAKRVVLSIGTGSSALSRISPLRVVVWGSLHCKFSSIATPGGRPLIDIRYSIFTFYQWCCVCQLFLGKFTPEDLRQAYDKTQD